MKKLLLLVLLVLLCFTVWAGDKPFFLEWMPYHAEMVMINGQTRIVALAKNPDPNGEIPAVKVLATTEGGIICYQYFDKQKRPFFFVFDGEKYISRPTLHCVKCHLDSRGGTNAKEKPVLLLRLAQADR